MTLERRLYLIVSVIVASMFVGIATPKLMAWYLTPKYAVINSAFFLTNNNNRIDAIASYAEALCTHDKADDKSLAAWHKAAIQCADSYRDDDVLVSSNDGKWLEYEQRAITEITLICVGQGYELCKWFK